MNLKIYAERLGELMFDAKIKPEELALNIGSSRATVYNQLTGETEPTVEVLVKICDYFNITADYLLGLENNLPKDVTFTPCPPFKDRLPELCEKFGLSRYRLQIISGISETSLYYWSKGKTVPTVDNLVKLATALGCTVDYILGRN